MGVKGLNKERGRTGNDATTVPCKKRNARNSILHRGFDDVSIRQFHRVTSFHFIRFTIVSVSESRIQFVRNRLPMQKKLILVKWFGNSIDTMIIVTLVELVDRQTTISPFEIPVEKWQSLLGREKEELALRVGGTKERSGKKGRRK